MKIDVRDLGIKIIAFNICLRYNVVSFSVKFSIIIVIIGRNIKCSLLKKQRLGVREFSGMSL